MENNQVNNKFLTVKDVAERLNISEQLVYKLSKKYKLVNYRIGGIIRISEQDLHAYLGDCAAKAFGNSLDIKIQNKKDNCKKVILM